MNSSDPAIEKYSCLNEYSYLLLQTLNWPREILLFFETDQEAMKILKVLFPSPKLVMDQKLEIRVKILPFSDINSVIHPDWRFQSSLEGFRGFPAKPLKVIHK